jgi:hypothetical protein
VCPYCNWSGHVFLMVVAGRNLSYAICVPLSLILGIHGIGLLELLVYAWYLAAGLSG